MPENSSRRSPARYEDRCKQRQVELDSAARELVEVCRALGDIQAIYVYGSYARQAVGPESDLDALIVRDSPLSRSARQDDIRLKLRSKVGFDLLVLTPLEFQNELQSNTVGRSILAEAMLLADFKNAPQMSGEDHAK